MPIRIHGEDLDLLQFFFRRDYEGPMGRRSIQGGIEDALLNEGAQMPGRSGDISDAAVRASERLRDAQKRAKRCSTRHLLVLTRAFGDGETEPLKSFGEFPRAVLACPEAEAVRQSSSDRRPLVVFLGSLARVASKGKGREQRRAVAQVRRLREASERLLVESLIAWGARVEGVSVPQSVSVNQIAKATGLANDTVKTRLEEKGALPPRRSMQPRAAFRISVRTLQTAWPEAANEILSQSMALREVDETAA